MKKLLDILVGGLVITFISVIFYFIIFIFMEDMERDVIVLKKLLNSKVFLNKFPVIDRVDVSLYGGIDIVLIPNDTKQYWIDKKEIYPYIWDLATMASVTSRFNVYP